MHAKTLSAATAAILLSLISVDGASAEGGCGIGFHRGPYGGCRANGGVVVVPGVVVAPPVVVAPAVPSADSLSGSTTRRLALGDDGFVCRLRLAATDIRFDLGRSRCLRCNQLQYAITKGIDRCRSSSISTRSPPSARRR